MTWNALEPVVPALPHAAEPLVLLQPNGGVKVLPKWNEEDRVIKWRLRHRLHEPGEPDATGTDGEPFGDGAEAEWEEMELRPLTRELPLSGLSLDAVHYFQVALLTPEGWSHWSRALSCVPLAPAVPAKITSVDIRVQDVNTALIVWARPPNICLSAWCGQITAYKLRVLWDAAEDGCSEIPEQCFRDVVIEEDTDRCEVSDLHHTKRYQFQVASQNCSGWSEFSSLSSVFRLSPPVPQKMTSPVFWRVRHHSVVVQWQHPPPNKEDPSPLDSFRLKFTKEGHDWITGAQERRDISPGLSQMIIDGLEPGETYVFKVAALNKFGMSSWSDSTVGMTTLAPSRPSRVEGLSVRHLYRSWVTLEWSPVARNGYEVTSHTVRYSHEDDLRDAVEIEPGIDFRDGAHTCDIRHLRRTRYFFQVAAANQIGVSDWSDPLLVDMSSPPPPLALGAP